MWLIILGAVLAATAAGLVYMTVCVGKFGGIQSLAGERKWLKYLISFLIIAILMVIFGKLLSPVNAVIIFLNVTLFFLVYGGIMRIVKHASGKEPAIYLQGWLALISCAVYLAAGYYLLHHVWQKNYSIKTDKNVTLRIAMFADSHLGTTFDADGLAEHLKTIEQQSPDILLIPGDFVDDSSKREDIIRACEALGKLDLKYGVWYTHGNHDKGYYNSRNFSGEELEQALRENGVHVMNDEYELVDDLFYVVGRLDKSTKDRKPINELIEGADKSKYMIVLDHQPNDYANEAAAEVDLVLSGHTHGGQLFPVTYVGEWFNINDRTYGHEKRGVTDFIVTSGISDWEILFKTGAKSEYVIIDVAPNN